MQEKLKMEVKKYFNTTKEEIESKKFNIFIPICLGNKFFLDKSSLTKNVSGYINWALKHTKKKVLILIVDKIQLTNWNVRNNKNTDYNTRRLDSLGKKIKENFEEFVGSLDKGKKDKIKIIRWEEYDKKDVFCSGTTRTIYQNFKNNKEFQNELFNSVKASITDRTFSKEKYFVLCDYLLDEFSVCYHGIEIDGDYYGLYPYHKVDSALTLIEEIKKGKKFAKFSKRIYSNKSGVVILN